VLYVSCVLHIDTFARNLGCGERRCRKRNNAVTENQEVTAFCHRWSAKETLKTMSCRRIRELIRSYYLENCDANKTELTN